MIKRARGQTTFTKVLYGDVTLDILLKWEGYSDPGRHHGPAEHCYPAESEIEWTPIAVSIHQGSNLWFMLPHPPVDGGEFECSLWEEIQEHVEELFDAYEGQDDEEDL
jgi:hypothetical protein